jgi:hypothetical protein
MPRSLIIPAENSPVYAPSPVRDKFYVPTWTLFLRSD